jgi:DNA replication protein DnaC
LLELTQAKADGSYHKQLKQLAKIQLLVIDDWGLESLKPAHRNDLMEIMDDRHGQTSTLMISQLPTDQWYVKTHWLTPFSTILCTTPTAFGWTDLGR